MDFRERCGIVAELQLFFVDVMRERQIVDNRPEETARHHRLLRYPWGWSTPAPTTVQLPALSFSAVRQKWKYTEELWYAVNEWASQLRWAHVGSEHSISFVELAVDFELTTGLHLPPVQNRRFQPPQPEATKVRARDVLPGNEAVTGLALYFDGGSRQNGTVYAVAGAGAVLYRDGFKLSEAMLPLPDVRSNNVAEYQGIIGGLALLSALPQSECESVLVRGDSEVVLRQLARESQCGDDLRPYYLRASHAMST